MRRLLAVLGLTFLAPASLTRAAPVNLLPNGEFDVDAAGWSTTAPATIGSDAQDYGRCGAESNSGLAAEGGIAPNTGFIFQCIPALAESTELSFVGHLLFPSGQTPTGQVRIWVTYYQGTDCVLPDVGHEEGPNQLSSESDVWVRHELLNLIAPSGTQSAHVGMTFEKLTGTDPLNMRLDGFQLVPGHGFLFYDGFEISSLCRWSADVP